MMARALLLLENGGRVLRLLKQSHEAHASHERRYSTEACLNIPLLHRRVKRTPYFRKQSPSRLVGSLAG